MKPLFISFLLSLGFLLLSFPNAKAQTFSEKSNYLNETESFELTQNRQEQYNPWTIHKKISGIGLSSSIAATLVGSLAMDDEFFGTTVLPVVGPFITISRIENNPGNYYRPGGKKLLRAAGIVQSAFLVYFVTSIIGESNYRGKHQSSKFSVAPVPVSEGVGVSMNVRF